MRTTAFARTHRRTGSRSAAHGWPSRTLRTLEDRLAPLRHDRTRRRNGGRTHRRGVNRARSRLRDDESPHGSGWRCAGRRLRRPPRRNSGSCGTRFATLRSSAGPRRGYSMKWRRCRRRGSCCSSRSCLQSCGGLGCRDFGHRNCCLYGFCYRRLLFDGRFGGLRRFDGGLYRRGRRLGRNHDRGRRTRYRLRRNEARSRLGRLHRSSRLGTGGNWRRRLRRRNCRRNGNRRRRRRSRTRRCSRLGRALRDRFQHIAGLGDVREIDLRLEVVGRRRSRTRATGCSAAVMLRKILLYAFRFVFFDGAGVRFFLGDTDLRENVENGLALHLEFSCQVIDSDLVLHYAPFPPLCPVWVTPS